MTGVIHEEDDLVMPVPSNNTENPMRPSLPSERTPVRSPGQVSYYESVFNRPRSNPRSRTPMRCESPLEADAFLRSSNQEEEPPRVEGQRVTVRPLAGASVGTILVSTRISEEVATRCHRSSTPKSSKQGPSHRKLRRWNNDNFVGIVADIARSSSKGARIAETLLKAQANAPLYRSIHDPHDKSPSSFDRFIKEDKFAHLRHDFFQGKIGLNTVPSVKPKRPKPKEEPPDIMLKRIDTRLRKVIERACRNSPSSTKIIDAMEAFLVECYSDGRSTTCLDVVDTLLEPPTVSETVRFCFDADTGGFQRLLLHGVCRFHGLRAVSTIMEGRRAKVLTVTGTLTGAKIRLSHVCK